MKKRILIVILVLLSLVGLSGFYTVKENEYGVVRQFGAIYRIDAESGLKYKIPLIQSVNKMSKSIVFYDIPESDVITKDKKSMVVDSFVLWKITNPSSMIRQLNGVQGRAEERGEDH